MTRIFLSYRRQDSAGVSGRIYDRLRAHFGVKCVFMDVDSIPYGLDFRTHVNVALDQCGVLLAVIGRNWAGEVQTGARRRIDDPRDFVRIEIEAALERNLPVIPILIDRTKIPNESDLPPSLAQLSYRHAIEVDQGLDFHHHVDRLIKGIERLLTQPHQDISAPEGPSEKSAVTTSESRDRVQNHDPFDPVQWPERSATHELEPERLPCPAAADPVRQPKTKLPSADEAKPEVQVVPHSSSTPTRGRSSRSIVLGPLLDTPTKRPKIPWLRAWLTGLPRLDMVGIAWNYLRIHRHVALLVLMGVASIAWILLLFFRLNGELSKYSILINVSIFDVIPFVNVLALVVIVLIRSVIVLIRTPKIYVLWSALVVANLTWISHFIFMKWDTDHLYLHQLPMRVTFLDIVPTVNALVLGWVAFTRLRRKTQRVFTGGFMISHIFIIPFIVYNVNYGEENYYIEKNYYIYKIYDSFYQNTGYIRDSYIRFKSGIPKNTYSLYKSKKEIGAVKKPSPKDESDASPLTIEAREQWKILEKTENKGVINNNISNFDKYGDEFDRIVNMLSFFIFVMYLNIKCFLDALAVGALAMIGYIGYLIARFVRTLE